MNPFYKLFCAAALLLACGTSAESAWENLARNPDTTLWSQESSQKVLRCLTDGSREIGMVTGENRGRILNFRFLATRQIDHIVLFTPYRRDAAVPRQVTLLLDGREFHRLELPDLPRRAIRIEVNREAASVSLRIDSMHGGEAPGGILRKRQRDGLTPGFGAAGRAFLRRKRGRECFGRRLAPTNPAGRSGSVGPRYRQTG